MGIIVNVTLSADLYIALFHHPVLNKHGRVVTSSVTNMDLHDLARNAATYGVQGVFIVTPSAVQRGMVSYIKDYWQGGFGARYNPTRRQAVALLKPAADLAEVCLTIKTLSGSEPLLVATSAKKQAKSVSYAHVRQLLGQERALLLAFGTGYGFDAQFMQLADAVLEPIRGRGDYNHLPVRSAVAIVLDRLVGGREEI